MAKEKLLQGLEEESTANGLVNNRKKSPFNNTTAKIAAAVLSVCAGGNAIAQTMEEFLGNSQNYQPVSFVDNTKITSWCRVDGNTLRWRNRNSDRTIDKILERDFQPVVPAGIEPIGGERLIYDREPDRGYNAVFDTVSGNHFENIGTADGVKTVFRNSDRIIETDLDLPSYFDFSAVASLLDGTIGVVVNGQDHDFYDNGDIREIPENISGNLPITTLADLRARSVHRPDLDPIPNQGANTTYAFAATPDHFYTSSIIQGPGQDNPAELHIYDRMPDGSAGNRRMLRDDPMTIGCTFGSNDAEVLFILRNYGLEYATFLKDIDNDGIVNIAPDNCVDTPNFDQTSSDLDQKGDACDNCPAEPLIETEVEDADSDGICARDGNQTRGTTGNDNCRTVFNPAQEDSDDDGKGDLCDPYPFCPQNTAEACETTDAGTDGGSDGGEIADGSDGGNTETDSGPADSGEEDGGADAGETDEDAGNPVDSGTDGNFPDGSTDSGNLRTDSGNSVEDAGEDEDGGFDGGPKLDEDAGPDLTADAAGNENNNLDNPDDKDPKGCMGCNQTSGSHAENCLYLLAGIAALGTATARRRKNHPPIR